MQEIISSVPSDPALSTCQRITVERVLKETSVHYDLLWVLWKVFGIIVVGMLWFQIPGRLLGQRNGFHRVNRYTVSSPLATLSVE